MDILQYYGLLRPKLCVGVMNEGVVVNDGDLIRLQLQRHSWTAQKFHEKNFPNDVNPRILLDDGKPILKLLKQTKKTEVVARVTRWWIEI
jgi:pyruvate kinase